MSTPVTPNVGFSLPTPDQYNQSPSWGQLINQNFQLADQLLPTSDNPLTPDRFLISADLDFRQFNAINLSSAQFTPLPSAAAALDSIYFYAGEFWITDNAGNQVQITSNGTVSSATGNISGLPSSPAGAGIAWNNSAGAFEFLGAGGTVRPTLKTGPVALYDTASGPPAFAVMLKSPSALAASYSATFPAAPPATTLPVQMNNSGALSTGTITKAQQAAVGQQISASSGVVSTTSAVLTPITNLSVTISTTGRPIFVGLMPVAGAAATIGANNSTSLATAFGATFRVAVTGSVSDSILETSVTGIGAANAGGLGLSVSPSSVSGIYVAAAGTYTFTAQFAAATGSSALCHNAVLYAYEL